MTTATLERSAIFLDKAAWGDGPWQQEPDKVQWVDEKTGLDCMAVRNASMGHWCGYVGVAEGHRFFGVGYDDVLFGEDVYPDVHGGLTYSDFCQENGQERGICHIPFEGRPERVWWLGFDCAHCFDLSPASEARLKSYGGNFANNDAHYKTLEYVRGECTRLAEQLVRC